MNNHEGAFAPSGAESVRVRWHLESGAGHQDAYALALQPPLTDVGIAFVDGAADTVFFPTLDFYYPSLLRSCIRSIFGGPKTVAMLLRPQNCVRPTKPIHFVKQILFRLLRRAPRVMILTIMPFSTEPKLATYANGWIHDPQLWDLAIIAPRELGVPYAPNSSKKTVVMLGILSRLKGFDQFVDLWIREPAVREAFRFIAAGKLDPELADLGVAFAEAGGELVNQWISDDQIYSYYREADIVWCAYDRSYDQASGIFGRAFQLGVPSVVTENSMLHRQAKELGQDVLALSPDWVGSSFTTANLLLSWSPQRVSYYAREAQVKEMRDRDIKVLATALRGESDL